jgi:hypothetical protein
LFFPIAQPTPTSAGTVILSWQITPTCPGLEDPQNALKNRRFSFQGRPRLARLGSSGSIFSHCSSDRNVSGIPVFQTVIVKVQAQKCLQNHL